MPDEQYVVSPIGWVESTLTQLAQAPKQGDEGAPDASLVFDPAVRDAISDLHANTELLVLTWFDRAHRDALLVHPRGDPSRPATGVFSTRSPNRPNPIGLHRVAVLDGADLRVRVRGLEAVDTTPILDIKPVISPMSEG